MGTVKLINWKVSAWCNTKFSSVIYKEMCWSQKVKEACLPRFARTNDFIKEIDWLTEWLSIWMIDW